MSFHESWCLRRTEKVNNKAKWHLFRRYVSFLENLKCSNPRVKTKTIFVKIAYCPVSLLISAQDGIVESGNAHTSSLRLPSKQCQCLFWLNTSRSRHWRVECMPLPFSTPFLQAISTVVLWPVHVQKIPQNSEYLCPAICRIDAISTHSPLMLLHCLSYLS